MANDVSNSATEPTQLRRRALSRLGGTRTTYPELEPVLRKLRQFHP